MTCTFNWLEENHKILIKKRDTETDFQISSLIIEKLVSKYLRAFCCLPLSRLKVSFSSAFFWVGDGEGKLVIFE